MGRNTKITRAIGFVTALGASAALVATAAGGTSAYFTDSHEGHLTGTAGTLEIGASGQMLNFSKLMPGVDQTKTINYQVKSESANADVWMVFDASTEAYGRFTGENHKTYGEAGYDKGGLGGFGHFKVLSDQGRGFESYNLALAPTGATGCQVNDDGTGGSDQRATGPDNASQAAPQCGVPAAIKIASDISAGHSHSADVTFGLTGKAYEKNATMVDVPFKIVATQVGIRPDAKNF